MANGDVLQAAHLVADALENAGFEYALGGAIALAYWGVPRATVDVDVGVACEPTQLPELMTVLSAAGCSLDIDKALDAAGRGDFGCRALGVRVDVFLPVLPIARSALDRRVQAPLGTHRVWIVTAEDAAILKLLFGRTKDIADLERLFAVQRSRLDFGYVDDWVGRMFPEGDARNAVYRRLRSQSLAYE